MFHDYSDITDRIAEPPKWWDEHGVPRYGEFSPYGVASIYAGEVALVEIACQACADHFNVAFSSQGGSGPTEEGRSLTENIQSGEIHYGDPPDYGNCREGASMTCFDLRVLQYWSRMNEKREWVRDSRLEISLPDMKEYGKS